MRFDEIKQRLDPKCWTGKKIGNPKTKMKGGVRVNNCVPAESVAEAIPYALSAANANAEYERTKTFVPRGYKGRVDTEVSGQKEYRSVMAALQKFARAEDQHIESGLSGTKMSVFSKTMDSEALSDFIDMALEEFDQGVAEGATTFDPMKGIHALFALERQYKSGNMGSYQELMQKLRDHTAWTNVVGHNLTKLVPGFTVNDFWTLDNIVRDLSDGYGLPEWFRIINDGGWEDLIEKYKHYMSQRHGQTMNEQGVAEAYNPEYDDEAGMAQGSLHTLQNAVAGLQDVIDSGDNLPEWCQEKISLAEDYLVTVWDYIQSEKAQGIDPEISEEFDLVESIINRIAAQNGVDAEMVWEDLESLSNDELYAFAVTSQLNEDWSKVNKKDKTDGMSQKAVNAYRRENPGSKLKTAVTTKPSKLKKGSKASKRRKSYCSRSKGQMNMHNISCAKTPDKAICKARRRWNC